MRAKVILDVLDGVLGLCCNSDVVDENRNDDVHPISEIDPDTVLTDKVRKSKFCQDLVELLVPASTHLLETVQRLQKSPDPLGQFFFKPLRLLHVDLLLQLAIEVGRGNISTDSSSRSSRAASARMARINTHLGVGAKILL